MTTPISDPIQALVARILNTTDLALNKGSNDGVETGMKFAILSGTGEDILDPETNEVLDSIPIAKTVVKVIQVTPRVAVARTFRSYTRSGIFDALSIGRSETRHETLESNERSAQQELDPARAKVNVGDPAVEYTGEYTGILYDF
ncbi:hypothetical protein MT349_18670 [Rathayibacter caricis]|uniref:hypothetical protein n=1 Tax=Rathayibacter caricis TaxID=110936 RepID=UPI001FB4C85D|nr:hypothetical protein [Rathayibacter caricis]MCJ1697811.1 hypothetical protein [Rathayibacter caricis]